MTEEQQTIAVLLHFIREDVIGLLFNRFVFRTYQEIVRRNPQQQLHPHQVFCGWTRVVYSVANPVGVRRVAGQTYQETDVNLVRLLNMFIREPEQIWQRFKRYYPDDAARASREVERTGGLRPGWEIVACKRLLSEDRRAVINAAEKANRFASKRAAHLVPGVEVYTTFSDLDEAIDALKTFTEKYLLLVLSEKSDLLEEMKRRKLPDGWDAIFLEPWATPEMIARPLGETPPPPQAD
jgi:hypothetical protein